MPARTYQPFRGVRVLSFELAFALPAGTRALSDLGAEVVRVSRPMVNYPLARYVSVVDGVFHGKPAIGIDLSTDRGKAIAFELAMEADVVSNNFRPGVLAKYGLDSHRLRTAKPDLIWLQLSGYGTPGPWSTFPAFGPSSEAAGGLNRLLVDEGEVPIRVGSGVFSDQLGGRYAALALVAALDRRRETGRGVTIDLSMTECITHMLGSRMVEAARSGKVPDAERNRDPRYVPQGVYPCSGNDEWLAISVMSERAWRHLVGLVNSRDLSAAMGFEQRQAAHDHIDTVIAAWTRDQDKDDLAARLQAYGIAAGPVRTVQDSALDPQFRARGSLQPVRHRKPVLGYRAHPQPPIPWRIVGRRRKTLKDYRTNGADNFSVLNRWLGYDRETVRHLEKERVLARTTSEEIAVRRMPNAPVDHDFAKRLGLPK